MTGKAKATQFLVTFVATFVSATVVMFLWNVIFHGTRTVDWATAVVLAVAAALALVIAEAWSRKRRAET